MFLHPIHPQNSPFVCSSLHLTIVHLVHFCDTAQLWFYLYSTTVTSFYYIGLANLFARFLTKFMRLFMMDTCVHAYVCTLAERCKRFSGRSSMNKVVPAYVRDTLHESICFLWQIAVVACRCSAQVFNSWWRSKNPILLVHFRKVFWHARHFTPWAVHCLFIVSKMSLKKS